MIKVYEEFHTSDEAESFWRNYMTQNPPKTFGTYLKKMRDRVTGLWIVSGHRFSTG